MKYFIKYFTFAGEHKKEEFSSLDKAFQRIVEITSDWDYEIILYERVKGEKNPREVYRYA